MTEHIFSSALSAPRFVIASFDNVYLPPNAFVLILAKWQARLISSSHLLRAFNEVFHSIRECVLAKWPNEQLTRYTAISGFIFLRKNTCPLYGDCMIIYLSNNHFLIFAGFFNPAILGPKLFGLIEGRQFFCTHVIAFIEC